MAEYIVLRIGIFFKILLTKSIIFCPKNERDSQPIIVINIRAISISKPGISNGR